MLNSARARLGLRSSSSQSTAPAKRPSGPGTKTCRNPPLARVPCASAQDFCAALKGACRNQLASRASQMGIDGSLLSAGAKTRPGPELVSVAGMQGWLTTIQRERYYHEREPK
jgi:hypothetical protein